MAKKTKANVIATREELEATMGIYAEQTLEFDRLTVEMEQRLAQIRAEYEGRMAECVERADAAFADLEAYAALHKADFEERRSLELLHGSMGYRTGTPAVKQCPGVKAEHSVELLAAGRPEWTRRVTTVDKESILAELAGNPSRNDVLRPYGLQIVQGEQFWAEVKRENRG